MTLPKERRVKCTLVIAFAMCCLVFVDSAAAQFHIPGLPGSKKDKNQTQPQTMPDPSQMPPQDQQRQQKKDQAAVKPPGVPVPLDSPIFEAFRKLEQQHVYHQRMTIHGADPRMEQMMAQMGFMPAETITAGNVKQVSMHLKMPFEGQSEDFELRSVSREGRLAKKWISPAKDRILAKQDAEIDRQLAQYEAQSASSIAKSLAMGPMGMAGAAFSGANAALAVAEASAARKQAHNFWEWSCMDGGAQPARGDSAQGWRDAPPLTDLRVVGDDTIDGVPVTSYEFYVRENGQFHGPMQLHVAKESGLPMRIGMNDPRAGGGMQMDYFGFNQGGDFEVPACLGDRK